MRKKAFLCLVLILAASLSVLTGCNDDKTDKYVEAEMRGCFDFFYNETNTDASSNGYGIIADRWPDESRVRGSVASTGFGLSALVIGVEKGYISRNEGEERAEATLENLVGLQQSEDSAYEGFFYHFLSMNDGKRYGDCEVSTIDTSILLCGALSAAEYFGGDVETYANILYSRVNWNAFLVKRGFKSYVSMAYRDGKISSGCWDWYAEQLMIYVLGAGSPTEEYRLGDKEYYDFTRRTGKYGAYSFIYSYFGSIFTYQFSHAWIDFEGYADKQNVSWYDNSVAASKAAYQYCVDNAGLSKSYSNKSWGLTACDVPGGYSGLLGAVPRGWAEDSAYAAIRGTIAPAGAIGSVVFTPEESMAALEYYYGLNNMTSKYGLLDSFNLDRRWTASNVIGIDKGISLLMLANYQKASIWKVFMQNEYVIDGMEVLGFEKQ